MIALMANIANNVSTYDITTQCTGNVCNWFSWGAGLSERKKAFKMKILNRKEKGVTLLELLVAIAIIAVVAMFAVPSFSKIINRNNVANATNQVIGFLNYARSTARAMNTEVYICAYDEEKGECQNYYGSGDMTLSIKAYTKFETLKIITLSNAVKMNVQDFGTGKGLGFGFTRDGSMNLRGVLIGYKIFNKDGSYNGNKGWSSGSYSFSGGQVEIEGKDEVRCIDVFNSLGTIVARKGKCYEY